MVSLADVEKMCAELDERVCVVENVIVSPNHLKVFLTCYLGDLQCNDRKTLRNILQRKLTEKLPIGVIVHLYLIDSFEE